MDYISEIKKLADQLDTKGFVKQADLLDKHLISLAQTAPAEDQTPAPEEDEIPEAPPLDEAPTADLNLDLPEEKEDKTRETTEKMARTTFYMLKDLRDFYAKNLPHFNYLGDSNIKTIQSAMDQLVTMYRVLLRNITKEFNKEVLENYEIHLKTLENEVDRSRKMKLTPTKVTVDKFIFYDEFEVLLKKIERHYDEGLRELQPVLRKARAVREAFANVIQQTSEEIAHADLIEVN